MVVSMASRTSASASTSGGIRCDSWKRGDADDRCPQEPQRDVSMHRRWEDPLVDAALHAGEDAVLSSVMKANCSYSRPMRGTWRSRNTSAKYCGCFLLNS